MKIEITDIKAREILDSRGNPTVEATVYTSAGKSGRASVPSGASTGSYEAHELRDNDKNRYNGRGVLSAVKNVNEIICPALLGHDVTDQSGIDSLMRSLDATKNKTHLGANAILSVSLAAAVAAADSVGLQLHEYLRSGNAKMPSPMFNLLNGGAHAGNNIDIQEFMVVPYGLPTDEAIRAGSEIYHRLGKILKSRGLSTAVGDEGGFAPDLGSDEEAIELLCLAIKEAGYSFDKVGIALDVASSEWAKDGGYFLPKRKRNMSADELIEYYTDLCDKYPIISIEDGLSEDDFDGWKKLTVTLGGSINLVGDDLFVTNEERLREGISIGIGNTILIKPNQIGSLSETMSVIALAREAGYKVILSHRSGETPDTAISDIAVAVGADFLKSGAPCRGERVAKYNRLLEISDFLKYQTS